MGCNEEARDEIYSRLDAVAPGIQLIDAAGAKLLGGPPTGEAIVSMLDDKIGKLGTLSDRLSDLSSQSAFFLLAAYVSFPRQIYFLRCAPTWRKMASLVSFDATLKDSLEAILNCELSPHAWMQSSLPVKLGGLGIWHAVDSAIPCFLASLHAAQPLISEILMVQILENDATVEDGRDSWSNFGAIEFPPETQRGLQKTWEDPIVSLQ